MKEHEERKTVGFMPLVRLENAACKYFGKLS